MRIITEAAAERIVDNAVWKRLATDARYRHAQNAEEQAAREDEITAEVWREIERKYDIS